MSNLSLGKSTELPVSYSAGNVIFAQGEKPRYLYLVKKGHVHLVKTSGQHLLVTKLCKEKEILNEVSVLMNSETDFAAIAKTEVELVLVEKKDILSVIKNGPSWVSEMFETLCDRLKMTEEIIEEHHLSTGENNPGTVLTKEEEKRYLDSLDKYKSR